MRLVSNIVHLIRLLPPERGLYNLLSPSRLSDKHKFNASTHFAKTAPGHSGGGSDQRVGGVELREQPERQRAAPPAAQGGLPRPDLRPVRHRRLKKR